MNLLLDPNVPHEILVELIRIVGNLKVSNFDYSMLDSSFGLIEFLLEKVDSVLGKSSDGSAHENDDLLLNCIILLGNMALDSNTTSRIIDSNLFESISSILRLKDMDDEIVYQSCYCLYTNLLNAPTMQKILKMPRILH